MMLRALLIGGFEETAKAGQEEHTHNFYHQERFRKKQSRGNRRHKAIEPCIQAEGPLLPIVLDPDRVSAHYPWGWGHSRC